MFKALFLAARPKTLTASLIPVWAGCMVVYHMTSQWNPSLAAFTFLSCLCIQIACNYFNDAIDFCKNADTKKRQGPKRMTATGAINHRTLLAIGGIFLLAACGFSVPLILERGWPIIAIGIPSLYFAYGYTGGPFPLAYKGLGEIFVILFFGLIAVLGTIFVQIGFVHTIPGTLVESTAIYNAGVVLGIQCGLLSAVMVSINNIRDRKEDTQTGKRTLAVKLGDAKARGLTIGFIFAAYLTLPMSMKALHLDIALSWVLWIPSIVIAGTLILLLQKTPANKKMNKLLALSSIHLIVYLITYTML